MDSSDSWALCATLVRDANVIISCVLEAFQTFPQVQSRAAKHSCQGEFSVLQVGRDQSLLQYPPARTLIDQTSSTGTVLREARISAAGSWFGQNTAETCQLLPCRSEPGLALKEGLAFVGEALLI